MINAQPNPASLTNVTGSLNDTGSNKYSSALNPTNKFSLPKLASSQ